MRIDLYSSYKEERNALSLDWSKLFFKYDIFPIPVLNYKNPKNFNLIELNSLNIDGLILTGGNDVNYNKKDKLSYIRNLNEKNLIKYSIKNKIPILGVCRGFHMLNKYFKGKVSKNNDLMHINKKHQIIIDKKFNFLGKKYIVNSFHNQVIKNTELSKNLDAIAYTSDNLIEAFKHKKYKIYGVQWHPERQNSNLDKKLFEIFLNKKK